ncbi:autotransporter domain-containing protein [Agrobacterium sp. NPDC089420]|uniref:autotransporter domain-containing protein n=1 Tax=Agrobacterium sp. NPDC089420 TaxID=3363918 RepID=UPI003850FF2A
MSTGDFEYLRNLPGVIYSGAYDASADGSVIVGRYDIGSSMRAFRWTPANGVMQDLGTLPNATGSVANAISADGSVVVGGSGYHETLRAFRWTAANGMQSLGVPPGGTLPIAYGVNANGSVIVGEYYALGTRAFRWTETDGIMRDLGALPGSTGSTAWAVSDDGSVVVGDSRFAIGPNSHEWRAFRWTAATGAMDPLGALAGGTASVAYNLSADGSVVIGQAKSGNGQRGFRWTEATGMVSVEDWLRGNGVTVDGDFTLNAMGVSADGNIIVGETQNGTSYIARVVPGETAAPQESGSAGTNPPQSENNPSSTAGTPTRSAVSTRSGIIDRDQYARTLATRPNAGIGLDRANTVLDGAHGAPMRNLLEPGRQSFSIVSDIGYSEGQGSAGGFGIADIGYGIGLEGGATARMAFGSLYEDRDIDTGGDLIHKGFYIAPELSLPLTGGLHATIGGYYAPGRASIERGYMNGGVMDFSRGEADLDIWAAKLRLDWLDALAIGNWKLTPYAGLTYAKAEMAAYTETGGAFPARFDANREKSTIIRAGLDGITDLGGSTRLLARAEAAYRLEKATAATTGAIEGLMGFSFAGQETDRFWLRGGLGAEFDIAGGTASVNLNVTTQGDDPTVWVRTGWKITF